MAKKKQFTAGVIVLLGFVFLYPTLSSYAEEDIEVLRQQIQRLQERIKQLEASRSPVESKDSLGPMWRQRDLWDPFAEMERMQEEMDKMFQDSFRFGGPSSRGMFKSDMYYDDNFDMKEEKDKYVIKFDMRGLNKDKLDIDINKHSITVRGEHSAEETEQGPDRYFRSQRFGTFLKTIPLPIDADTSRVKSEKKGDHLVITLPKK